jgi:toxin HigB-1
MIRTFGDAATEDFYHGRNTARARKIPSSISAVARRRLDMLAAAHDLRDLRSPPGNHLEALYGDLKGNHSIRINDQWRIVFRWSGTDAFEVRIDDYH